jgi:hypothetical protein
MPVSVNVQTVRPRKLAAVRREVAPGAVGSAWGPAVGKVCDFIRGQSGLWIDGHRLSRARRYSATSVSRSRAHLKLPTRCTRPKRQGAKLLSPSTAGRTPA